MPFWGRERCAVGGTMPGHGKARRLQRQWLRNRITRRPESRREPVDGDRAPMPIYRPEAGARAGPGLGGAGAGRVRGGKTIRASERRRRSTDSYSDSTHPADASIYIGSKWRRTRQRLYDDDSLTRSGRFTEQGPGVTGHLPPRVSAPSPGNRRSEFRASAYRPLSTFKT